jgi:anti-anti-sigma factor
VGLLEFGSQDDAGVTLLVVSGEVDMATAPAFLARLLDAPPTAPLVVDMSAVTFMDSGGLNALLVAYRERVGSATIQLRNPSTCVRRLISVAVPGVFEIV